MNNEDLIMNLINTAAKDYGLGGLGNLASPAVSIGGQLSSQMAYKSVANLGETNKRLPSADPFETPNYYNPPLWRQIYNKVFAMGGIVNNNGQELENNEAIETPNGQVAKLKGKTHEQGGIQTNLEEGTKVYSNRIKIDGKTMSERKLEREKQNKKLEKKYNKDTTDIVNKNTLERIEEVNNLKEYYDTEFQNMVNEMITQKMSKKYAYGTGGDGIPTGGDPKDPNSIEYWQYPIVAQSISDYLNENNFNEFTDFYKNTTGREYPETFENFKAKINEATNSNLGANGYIKKDIYSNTHTDNGIEISTLPNLGLFSQYLYKNNDTYKNNFNNTLKNNNLQYVNGSIVPIDTTDTTGINNIKDTTNINGPTQPDEINQIENTDTEPLAQVKQPETTNQEPLTEPKNPVPTPSEGVPANQNSNYNPFLNDYNGTIGDAIGSMGTLLGGIGPASLTLKNRLEDLQNRSFFKNYGNKGLKTLDETGQMAKSIADEYLKDIDLYSNTSNRINRESARTVNVQRALDTVTHMQTLKARENITKSLLNTMSQIQAQKATMENQRDKVTMGAEYQADLANRQDRDAFYTNLNKDLNTSATYLQKYGADTNSILQNKMFLQILPTLSQYGIGFNVDENGNLIMYNDNGNTQDLKTQ